MGASATRGSGPFLQLGPALQRWHEDSRDLPLSSRSAHPASVVCCSRGLPCADRLFCGSVAIAACLPRAEQSNVFLLARKQPVSARCITVCSGLRCSWFVSKLPACMDLAKSGLLTVVLLYAVRQRVWLGYTLESCMSPHINFLCPFLLFTDCRCKTCWKMSCVCVCVAACVYL